jgi:hypothetical protein
MGSGVIVIKKEVDGEEWENTYPFSVVGPGNLSNLDLVAIGAEESFTPENTNYSDAGYDPEAVPMLQAVLAFERAMHYTPIRFKSVYVTDHLENSAPTDLNTNTFFVQPLSFNGLGPAAQGDLAPGNTPLMLTRVPAVFSRRSGRIYMRGVLLLSQVRFAGKGLVDWSSDAARLNMVTAVQTASTNSGLTRYFSGGGGVGETGIGQYIRGIAIPPSDVGDIYNVTPIREFRVDAPVSRQVKRGKKRAV